MAVGQLRRKRSPLSRFRTGVEVLQRDPSDQLRRGLIVWILSYEAAAHRQLQDRPPEGVDAVGVVGEGFPVGVDSGPGGVEVVVGLGVREGVEGRGAQAGGDVVAGLLAGFEVVAELHEFVDLRHDAFLLCDRWHGYCRTARMSLTIQAERVSGACSLHLPVRRAQSRLALGLVDGDDEPETRGLRCACHGC